jgi:hypothetical protein
MRFLAAIPSSSGQTQSTVVKVYVWKSNRGGITTMLAISMGGFKMGMLDD